MSSDPHAGAFSNAMGQHQNISICLANAESPFDHRSFLFPVNFPGNNLGLHSLQKNDEKTWYFKDSCEIL